MRFEDLSPEVQEKVRACKSVEEIFELAKSEGHELTEDELAQVSGGDAWGESDCRGDYHLGPFLFASEAADGDKLYTCRSCNRQVYESKLKAAGGYIW